MFEDGGGDDDGEGAVLDAGLDGDGEALWEVKARNFGDDETRGHGDEVERDGDTSQGGEVFLEQVDVFGDEANDDDDKDDRGGDARAAIEFVGKIRFFMADEHADADGQDGDGDDLEDGFDDRQFNGLRGTGEVAKAPCDDQRDGDDG